MQKKDQPVNPGSIFFPENSINFDPTPKSDELESSAGLDIRDEHFEDSEDDKNEVLTTLEQVHEKLLIEKTAESLIEKGKSFVVLKPENLQSSEDPVLDMVNPKFQITHKKVHLQQELFRLKVQKRKVQQNPLKN